MGLDRLAVGRDERDVAVAPALAVDHRQAGRAGLLRVPRDEQHPVAAVDALRIPVVRVAVLAVPLEAAEQPARQPRRERDVPAAGRTGRSRRSSASWSSRCRRGTSSGSWRSANGLGSIGRRPVAGGVGHATSLPHRGHPRRAADPPQHPAAVGGARGQLGHAPALGRGRVADARLGGRGPGPARPRAGDRARLAARWRRCPPAVRWTASAACRCSRSASWSASAGCGLAALGSATDSAPVGAARADRRRLRQRHRAARPRRGRRHVPARAPRARDRARAVRRGVRRHPRPAGVQPAAARARPRRRRARAAVAGGRRLHARRRLRWSCSSGPTRSGSPSCSTPATPPLSSPPRRCARSSAAPARSPRCSQARPRSA